MPPTKCRKTPSLPLKRYTASGLPLAERRPFMITLSDPELEQRIARLAEYDFRSRTGMVKVLLRRAITQAEREMANQESQVTKESG